MRFHHRSFQNEMTGKETEVAPHHFLSVGLELSQKTILRPELRLTQQMLVTIKLLSLARPEFEEVIRQEMMDNPALEESFEAVSSKERADAGGGEFDFDGLSLYPGGRKGTPTQSGDGDQDMEERFRREDSLFDEVLRQVRLAFEDAPSRAIGSHIAGNLNRDGYLACAVEEIAAACGTAPCQVRRVLTVMQGFEPAGVCACDLKECLLIQLERLEARDHLAEEIIRDHLRLLERGDLQALCRATGTTMEAVQAAVRTIRGLEPKPGRPFYGEISRHVVPDAYAFRKGERVEIRLNDKGLPRLTVSRRFGELLKRKGAITKADRAYLKDKGEIRRIFHPGGRAEARGASHGFGVRPDAPERIFRPGVGPHRTAYAQGCCRGGGLFRVDCEPDRVREVRPDAARAVQPEALLQRGLETR